MKLHRIYQPIKKELKEVNAVLETSLAQTKNASILEVNRFLLESGGKRLRPALVILSAKATLRPQTPTFKPKLTKIAAAIELIHMASLIHDDVIDYSHLRHHRPTLNSKWGQDVSIACGDYLYSLAFKLISTYGNTDILDCISSATQSMCEGELIQVIERDNLSLLKERYILIVKKKTAALFAASCQAGGMTADCPAPFKNALKQYGLNFGIAFQIVDDCLDFVGQEEDLGKSIGSDFKMGELTLPVLHLLSQRQKDKNRILSLLRQPQRQGAFKEIRERLINSQALLKTKEDISAYIQKAKKSLDRLSHSCFKQGLFALADYLGEKVNPVRKTFSNGTGLSNGVKL